MSFTSLDGTATQETGRLSGGSLDVVACNKQLG